MGGAIGAAAGLALGYDAAAARSSSLQGRPWLDAAAFAFGVGGLVLPKALERDAARPGSSRWSDCRCDAASGRPSPCVDSLNGFDRAVRKALRASDQGGRELWTDLSHATLVASFTRPLALIVAAERDTGETGRSLLVFAEAEAVALGLNGFAKHVFHRPRPYAHFGEPPEPGALAKEDSRLSFFSGHATASFAAAVTAGRLADLRGYRNRGWIWGTGLTVAFASGAARIAGDRHYATDVLVGMIVGSASGWAIPKLHERSLRREARSNGAPEPRAGPFASPGPAVSLSAPLGGKNIRVGLGPWADGVGAAIRLGW